MGSSYEKDGVQNQAFEDPVGEVDGTRALKAPFSLTLTTIETRKLDPALRSKSDKL